MNTSLNLLYRLAQDHASELQREAEQQRQLRLTRQSLRKRTALWLHRLAEQLEPSTQETPQKARPLY